jgi:SPP1 gp7 family putative phage head morphogenesis protein
LGDIYNGAKTAIPYQLYTFTAYGLWQSYKKGYGKELYGADWTIDDTELINRVQNNFFSFSGAKSFDEMMALRDAVYQDGKIVPFSKFREKAFGINKRYNVQYLEAERQQVMRAGTMGSKWLEIEADKDIYPYLKYTTQGDSHVREEHQALNGLVFPVNDPFWDSYYPPNGWRCRCSVRQLSERDYAHQKPKDQPSSDQAQKMAGKTTPKEFRNNVGTSEVFTKDGHPYYKASKDAAEKQLSATKHYGMRTVDEIYGYPAKLAKYKGGIANRQDYENLWKERQGTDGAFTLTDKRLDITATFDQAFKQKMLEKDRYKYFDEAFETFSKPDEVWGIFKGAKSHLKNEYFNTYIKYYEDKPIVMLVNKQGRVDSFYKLDSIKQIEDFRLGVLKYKK